MFLALDFVCIGLFPLHLCLGVLFKEFRSFLDAPHELRLEGLRPLGTRNLVSVTGLVQETPAKDRRDAKYLRASLKKIILHSYLPLVIQ